MPWEKAFNEDKALEAAMTLFWEKGYNDASMANLLEATKLTKGSFYNAFGSKKNLFMQALLKYDLENRRTVLQKLVAMDQPYESIAMFFDLIVDECVQDTEKKGCFVINTSLTLNSHDEDIQAVITNAIAEVETFFKQMIELGQLRGSINKDLNAVESAKSLMGAVVAIRVLGRGTYERDDLEAIANRALSSLK